MESQSPNPSPCWSNILKQQPNKNPNLEFASSIPIPIPIPTHDLKSTKGIALAIVDANAIIQGGERLPTFSDKFVTISEVLSEIRDPTSRHRLSFLPFAIETLEPSPEALKKVLNFARATGDLQTLSDVDLKLIALTYTLEAQFHGTKHLRDSPPPIHVVNVKRLPEKDLPGWGSNVPNLEEWEALEAAAENTSNHSSRILPLKDLSLNIPTEDQTCLQDGSVGNGSESLTVDHDDTVKTPRGRRRYSPKKREVKIEGKKMVADGIDASLGQYDDGNSDWLPAVSRNTHRRFLRRKSQREMYEASMKEDEQQEPIEKTEGKVVMEAEYRIQAHEYNHAVPKVSEEENKNIDRTNGGEDISSSLKQMRLEEDALKINGGEEEITNSHVESESIDSHFISARLGDGDNFEVGEDELDHLENGSVVSSYVDDETSEQSWMLRSLSDSTVACITGDFAMQNVILQMGLRLLAPGGLQIRELHRWVLKCHACNNVTAEIGRIFCPKCGNGGTLRKVAVTVGENDVVLAARKPRISLRGTMFSLPLPLGGRDAISKNPILREDQLPKKFLLPKTKKKSNNEDDIFASDVIFSHHSEKKAPHRPPVKQALAVFGGKRNPNDNHYSRSKH